MILPQISKLKFQNSIQIIVLAKMKMHNLSPIQKPKKKIRISRGYGGKGGGTGGRGSRGQKSRSGGGSRPGFEGGQLPLYRRLPKLKGIAGGMKRSLNNFAVLNIADCERAFQENEEVDLNKLIKMKLINGTGSDRMLPLKILGHGSLTKPIVVKAEAFSASAKSAIEAAGGKVEIIRQKEKWTR